jgi:hypothetical protein
MPDRTFPWEIDPMPGGKVVCPVTGTAHTGAGTYETASGTLTPADVEAMRDAGWSVGMDGFWRCPAHRDRARLVLHPTNLFCVKCGSTRGGAYGHVIEECKAGPSN